MNASVHGGPARLTIISCKAIHDFYVLYIFIIAFLYICSDAVFKISIAFYKLNLLIFV